MTSRRRTPIVAAALGFTLALLTLGTRTGHAQSSPLRLTDVTVTSQPDAVTVHVKTSGPATYQADLIDTPDRLVLDLADTTYAWRKTPLNVGSGPLKQIRGSQYRKGIARVVLELTRRAGYAIREDADGLAIVIPATATAAAKPAVEKSTPKSTPKSTMVASAPTASPKVASPKPDVALQKAAPAPRAVAAAPVGPTAAEKAPAPTPRPQPSVRVVEPPQPPVLVAQAAPAPPPAAPPPPARTNGQHQISFDFKDADVVNLLRILAAESDKNIVIGDDVKGKMSISLRSVPWELALDTVLEARALQKVEKDGVMRIVSTDQLSKEREAKARLEEAKLKAEADVRSKIAEAQIKEQEAEQRRRAAEAAAAEAQARGPLVEETIRLAYADPEDVAATLQGLLGIAGPGGPSGPPPAGPPFSALYPSGPGAPPAPPSTPSGDVLAKGITIRAHKPTNSIFIRHYQADLERIKKLVREKLDIPLPQVKIEARLSELNRRDFFAIGVQWGGAGVRTDGRNILVGQGIAGQLDSTTGKITAPTAGGVTPRALSGGTTSLATVNQGLGATPFAGFLPVSGTTGLPLGGNVVSFPASSLLGGTPAGVAFGIVGRSINLNLVLQALEEQSKARSLSKPEVVTVENAKASISLGAEIPYATVSSAGTQVQFKDAVLKLEVTPTVIFEPNATKIKMKVIVTNDKETGRFSSGVPILSKQHAETEVIVKEGETLVIGGITQRSETETVEKVPLLGDIPILGWLFKQKSFKMDPNNELVVFVTPSIVKTDAVAPGSTPPPAK